MKNNINERVQLGLDGIDQALTADVSAKSLVFFHNLISELRRFWLRSARITGKDHEFFIGDKDEGVLAIIEKAYFLLNNEMLPTDLREKIANGDFECPDFPYYYTNGPFAEQNG